MVTGVYDETVRQMPGAKIIPETSVTVVRPVPDIDRKCRNKKI